MAREKVLIVDDEPAIRWAMRQALTTWGFNPVEAPDAAAAKDAFETQTPDVVLLDINLPDGSGLELLRRFKGLRPKTAVIIVSGEVFVENTIEALRGGADDFITKPIDLNELRIAMQNGLRTQREPPRPAGKQKVLIVADSAEGANRLRAMIGSYEIEIESAKTQEEIERACGGAHDLTIVDLSPAQLRAALPKLRASAGHAQVPVLVSVNQIAGDPNVVGLLPQYRAMPCSLTEMELLLQRRMKSMSEIRSAKALL
jgi:DNA-binding response OmpR family regulator